MKDIVDRDLIRIYNYFYLGLNGTNYEYKMKKKKMWILYFCSFYKDGERSFIRKNVKYRLVVC